MNRKNINIVGINEDNHSSAKNICKNKGIKYNDFLRPIIMDIISSTDERLKSKPKNNNEKQFRLNNIITNCNICENIGVSKSSYLKIKIAEELLKYPSYMKTELK